jgi:pimeloyl-ACP methyl ester carboxylesterase
MAIISIRRVAFEAAGEDVAVEVLTNDPRQKPKLLILHGAGKSSRARFKRLAETLLKHYGVGSLIFDFPSHGESSGEP